MTVKNFDPELVKKLPEEVKTIFRIFLTEEYDSIRLVGGCVRDMLFVREVKDFDFATKFLPQETIKILEKNNIKAVPTGIKFGTITAVINHKHYEITTLRKDNEQDGRHCEPEFVDDYMQDASRRDFTINALYMNDHGLIYDYFDGLHDISNHVVRFIGDAKLRIEEDFLRILRFFRFSARYAGMLDIQGLEACIKHKSNIQKLSSERIRNELFRIISNNENERLLWILQEIEDNKIREEIFSAKFFIHNLANLLDIEQSFKIKLSDYIKFAALIFLPNENVNLDELFSRLNFSNQEKTYFNFLYKYQNSVIFDIENAKEFLVYFKKEWVRDLFLLESLNEKNKALSYSEIKDILDYINNFSLPLFPLNGNDLMNLGYAGKDVGLMLDKAKKRWIESDFRLSKEELLKE